MSKWEIDIDAVVREVLAQLAGDKPSTDAEMPAPTTAAPESAPKDLPRANTSAKTRSPSALNRRSGVFLSAPAPRMQATVSAPARTRPDNPREETKKTAAQPNGAGRRELFVADAVVTLASIEGRLRGIRTLRVAARAVVTPSVLDELRRRRIILSRAAPEQPPRLDGHRLTLMATGSRFNVDPLVKMLEGDGMQLELHRATCLIKATDTLAASLGDDRAVAVLTTRHPAAGLCLANRHAGVRAIGAVDPSRVLADAEAIGANLLVVDPVELPLAALKQMIGRFVELEGRTCPESLRERLA